MEKPITSIEDRNKQLGQHMQQYRKAASVTQQEMSEFCNASKNHLSKIEHGVCKCPAHIFIDYGKKLNVSLNALADSPTPSEPYIIPELQTAISQLSKQKQQTLVTIAQALAKD